MHHKRAVVAQRLIPGSISASTRACHYVIHSDRAKAGFDSPPGSVVFVRGGSPPTFGGESLAAESRVRLEGGLNRFLLHSGRCWKPSPSCGVLLLLYSIEHCFPVCSLKDLYLAEKHQYMHYKMLLLQTTSLRPKLNGMCVLVVDLS